MVLKEIENMKDSEFEKNINNIINNKSRSKKGGVWLPDPTTLPSKINALASSKFSTKPLSTNSSSNLFRTLRIIYTNMKSFN